MMQYHVSGKMPAAITVRNDIPWQYQQHQLPSATYIEFTSGPFGAVLSQVIANEDWTVQQVQFFITRPVRLYPVASEPLAALQCMLAGNVPCVLKGFGNVMLREKELYFFYVPAGTRNMAFFSKGYYESFHISFTPGYLSGFTHNGSPLKDVYQQLQQGGTAGGYAGSCTLSLQAMEQVEKIRQCQLQGSRRKLYYQARINDLMLLYMTGLEDAGHDTTASGKYEKEMQQLASYVADNLEKPLTAALLAGKMGLPLQVAEREFRKLYQQTIRSFIHDQRMKRAKLLLAEGKMPVTDVAYTVGFADVAYFSNAFKKQFGITPTGYQQLKKQR